MNESKINEGEPRKRYLIKSKQQCYPRFKSTQLNPHTRVANELNNICDKLLTIHSANLFDN